MTPAAMPAFSWSVPSVGETLSVVSSFSCTGSAPYCRTVARSSAGVDVFGLAGFVVVVVAAVLDEVAPAAAFFFDVLFLVVVVVLVSGATYASTGRNRSSAVLPTRRRALSRSFTPGRSMITVW